MRNILYLWPRKAGVGFAVRGNDRCVVIAAYQQTTMHTLSENQILPHHLHQFSYQRGERRSKGYLLRTVGKSVSNLSFIHDMQIEDFNAQEEKTSSWVR